MADGLLHMVGLLSPDVAAQVLALPDHDARVLLCQLAVMVTRWEAQDVVLDPIQREVVLDSVTRAIINTAVTVRVVAESAERYRSQLATVQDGHELP